MVDYHYHDNSDSSGIGILEFDLVEEVKNLISRYMNKITLEYGHIEILHMTIS